MLWRSDYNTVRGFNRQRLQTVQRQAGVWNSWVHLAWSHSTPGIRSVLNALYTWCVLPITGTICVSTYSFSITLMRCDLVTWPLTTWFLKLIGVLYCNIFTNNSLCDCLARCRLLISYGAFPVWALRRVLQDVGHYFHYRSGKRCQTPVIKIDQQAILRFVAPQGRHDSCITAFRRAKFNANSWIFGVLSPQNRKNCQNCQLFRPARANPLPDVAEIRRVYAGNRSTEVSKIWCDSIGKL